MSKSQIQQEMLEHSKAKVELYTQYLLRYLRVIGNLSYIHKIMIFDLFSGEGIYQDQSQGSPIAALEVIKEYLSGAPPQVSIYMV